MLLKRCVRAGLPLIAAVVVCSAVLAASTAGWRDYHNHTLGLTLKFPSGWRRAPDYNYRYVGKDGFFQLDAIAGESVKLDRVVSNEIHRKVLNYGALPKIKTMKVDGREARLIVPSGDQPKDMRGQAVVIVRMAEPTRLGCQRYNFLILWADKDHIRDIAGTVKFVKRSANGRC